MAAAASILPSPSPLGASVPSVALAQPPLVPLTWEQFCRRYLAREDKYKYEWVNGQAEKSLRNMDESQSYIFANLADFLAKLKTEQPIYGHLISEVDCFFAGNHRRPDIAFFTKEQIRAAKDGARITPNFVLEVISNTDQMNKVHKKMVDYRRAEVPVIWHVFPKLQQIHVYRGKQMTLCEHDDLCSAEPVIPGFSLPAADVFK